MATYEPGDEPGRCCAKAKGSGARCRNLSVLGRNVCRMHGGLGGRPAKNGRYSRYIKTGALAKAYSDALNDPTQWDIDEHLAVLDAACRRSAERLDEKDTPGFRSGVRKLVVDCEKARDQKDYAAFVEKFDELAELAKRGAAEDGALEEFLRSTERRAKRLEEAWKIRLSAAHAINSRDLVTVLARFMDIVEQKAEPSAALDIRQAIEVELLQSHKHA